MEKNKLFVLPPLIKNVSNYLTEFRCPICHHHIERSTYLKDIFENDLPTLWVANLVTHYRHNHITSWNKCWGRSGGHYRHKWFGDYDEEKAKVNERAKRQLLRKGWQILKENGVRKETFEKLQNTSPDTIKLAKKLLVEDQYKKENVAK